VQSVAIHDYLIRMNFMVPRILHKWYAKLNHYFWLPCPVCGRYFGGHEKHGKQGIITKREKNEHGAEYEYSTGVCEYCDGTELSIKNGFKPKVWI